MIENNGDADDGMASIAIMVDLEKKGIRIQFAQSVTQIGLDLESAGEFHRMLGDRIVRLVEHMKKDNP